MPNTQLYNDKISTFLISGMNGAGANLTIPTTAALTATSSKPTSLTATAAVASDGTNQWRLTVTPLVQQSTGITVTVTGPGLNAGTETFDIVPDPAILVGVSVGSTPVSTSAQPVPVAPGP